MSSKKSSKAAKSMDKLRAFLNVAIKKLSPVLPFLFKFVCFFLAFRLAAGSDLYDMSGMLHGLLCKSYVHVGLALMCALLPSRFGTLLVLMFMGVGLVKTSLMGGALLVVFGLVIFLITVCFVPDYVYLLLLVPFFISKSIYLLIPLLVGLYGSPIAVIAIFMGALMWGLRLIAPEMLTIQSISEGMELREIIKELPSVITYTSKYGVEELLKNKSVLLAGIVLCAVCFLTWLLQKSRTNYNRYIAIFVAGFLGILGLLVGKSVWGMYGSTGAIVLLGFAAMIFCALLCFLDMPLDYRGVRNISFSDDEYFYQVRLTPIATGFTAAKAAMLDKKSKKQAKEAEPAEKAEEDAAVKRASRKRRSEESELSESQQKAETRVLSREETREIREAELVPEEEASKAESKSKKADKKAEKAAAAEARKKEQEARKAAAKAEKAEEQAEEAASELKEEGRKSKKAVSDLWSSFKKDKKEKAEKVLDENGEEILDVIEAFSEETEKADDLITDLFDEKN